MAELKFLGFLAEKMGGRRCEVFLKKPTRLRSILPCPLPEVEIIVLIGEKPGHMDSMIENNDSVALMLPISGG
jgi:hypothetical protein